MDETMDITIVSAAFYPDEEPARPMLDSAKKHGIDVTLYGTGMEWEGFHESKVVILKEILKSLDSEYILYVDAGDLVFSSGLSKIISAYRKIVNRSDSTIVMGADSRLRPFEELRSGFWKMAPENAIWKYPCAGVIMGTRTSLIKALNSVDRLRTEMKRGVPKKYHDDDQGWWIQAIARGLVNVALDYDARLTMSMCGWRKWWFKSFPDPVITKTGFKPPILHFNGRKAKAKLMGCVLDATK